MKSILYLCISTLILLSCTQSPVEYKNQDSDKQISIAKANLSLDLSVFPSSVVRISGALTNTTDSLTVEFQIQGDSAFAMIEDISGGNWAINIAAFDKNDTCIYQGAADIYVQPGEITAVKIELHPLQGDVSVVVTWNTDSYNAEILFYGVSMLSNDANLFIVDFNGNEIKQITQGNCRYPVWFNNKQSVLYLDVSNHYLMLKPLNSNNTADEFLTKYDKNIIFLRYSKQLNSLLYCYLENNQSHLGVMDLNNFEALDIGRHEYDERNPVTNNVDDWIYFLTKRGDTFDIYRTKMDGESYEPVLVDNNFDFGNFSISADGQYLVTPKSNAQKATVVIYNIATKQIEEEINVNCHEPGEPLYTSLSYDNQFIFFVVGVPNVYSIPRNIYRMKIDGSNLTQLTSYDNLVASRPLAW